LLDIPTVDFFTERLDDRKHPAIREIAVMGNGRHVAAGLFLIRGHPFPQVYRIVAAERLHGGVWLDLTGLGAIVTKNDISVQVIAAGIRGPLVADEGRKPTGIVRFFGRLDGFPPGPAIGRGAGDGEDRLGYRSLTKLVTMSKAVSAPLPEWINSFHLRPCGSAMISGLPLKT
jgi:hypothetical protein